MDAVRAVARDHAARNAGVTQNALVLRPRGAIVLRG